MSNGYSTVWVCPFCAEKIAMHLEAETERGPCGVLAVTMTGGETFTAEAWAHLWQAHPGVDHY